ncbi:MULTISPECIES: Crp/Fnr family transcriptional regulator [unclassified Pseudomonas]|uniref:Crp/Fnr family transcriptional regulator n=1 Tax=unclassified Pseudomonas TaxID=196821 RepID=UPI00129EA924|nr:MULTISPECIES: Crp/Fnr family transcriptional regulator [unclassified Pseudomonas]MDH4651879.1 Crp/Fnr family transcriptional regulator [Pseudomonas sp. BN606]MRK21684.1 Crp/Fnr family transcriptional regulator [Pseudomonas sp. JG-B]
MTEFKHYLDRLRTGQWFSQLPAGLQEELLTMAQLRRLEPGQRLFRRGDPPCGLYAVLEGAIRVGSISESGKEALLVLVEPPHWFGEISLFDGQSRTHDAFAEGQVILLNLPQAPLLSLLKREPWHWRDFALLMSQKLRLAFIALEEMSLLPAPQRLARRLLMIAEGYGERSGQQRVIQLAQEQLAMMLAISRQTTNQILKDLEAQGALRLSYGEIEILDPERLKRAAQGKP